MTKIMGILNVTPDSFTDGGLYLEPEKALEQALLMQEQGADIIDIGAESTQPGATPVSVCWELRRLVPVVSLLIKNLKIKISIDTYKWKVARECLKLGADIINDVNGLGDERMQEIVAEYQCPAIVMHRGPASIREFFEKRSKLGSNLIFDPGFGFGKTPEQNWKLLTNLAEIELDNYPLLIGTSRKSFRDDNSKKYDTLATLVIGMRQKVDIVRVHDVALAQKAKALVA